MTSHVKLAEWSGAVAVAVAAVIGVIAPVSKASAGTAVTLSDNWSGIGDNGITVNAGGESYSGYPIGPQAVQITPIGGRPITCWPGASTSHTTSMSPALIPITRSCR